METDDQATEARSAAPDGGGERWVQGLRVLGWLALIVGVLAMLGGVKIVADGVSGPDGNELPKTVFNYARSTADGVLFLLVAATAWGLALLGQVVGRTRR